MVPIPTLRLKSYSIPYLIPTIKYGIKYFLSLFSMEIPRLELSMELSKRRELHTELSNFDGIKYGIKYSVISWN